MPTLIQDLNACPTLKRDSYANENGRKWWFKFTCIADVRRLLKKHDADKDGIDWFGPDFFATVMDGWYGERTLLVHYPTAAVRKRMLRGEDC